MYRLFSGPRKFLKVFLSYFFHFPFLVHEQTFWTVDSVYSRVVSYTTASPALEEQEIARLLYLFSTYTYASPIFSEPLRPDPLWKFKFVRCLIFQTYRRVFLVVCFVHRKRSLFSAVEKNLSTVCRDSSLCPVNNTKSSANVKYSTLNSCFFRPKQIPFIFSFCQFCIIPGRC